MQAILVARTPDEQDILAFVLKQLGLRVATSPDLTTVADRWLERPSDLIVTAWGESRELTSDIMALRSVTQAPLILMVNPPTENQLCRLLQAGADIVLNRPVAPLILTEYIRALLRRTQTVPTFVLPRLTLPDITLNPDSREVTVSGQPPSRLTQLEFRLLYVLMVNRGQVIPVDMIVERVWGYPGHGNRDLVRGLVSRLRRKIEPDKGEPAFIQNIPGVGYRFFLEED